MIINDSMKINEGKLTNDSIIKMDQNSFDKMCRDNHYFQMSPREDYIIARDILSRGNGMKLAALANEIRYDGSTSDSIQTIINNIKKYLKETYDHKCNTKLNESNQVTLRKSNGYEILVANNGAITAVSCFTYDGRPSEYTAESIYKDLYPKKKVDYVDKKSGYVELKMSVDDAVKEVKRICPGYQVYRKD